MTNPTVIDLIHCHGSVRKYQPDPISAETIEAMSSAGQRASTSSNLQMTSVVAVTERPRAPAWPSTAATSSTSRRRPCSWPGAPICSGWNAPASCVATQVTDYVENFLIAAVDAAIAAQTAALAAESLGLGICYIGSIRNTATGRHRASRAATPGLPRRRHDRRLAGRASRSSARACPLKAVLHWENYDTAARDEAMHEYDRAMIATGIYEGRQVPVPGKPERVEDYGWTEHSARRVAQACADRTCEAVIRETGVWLEVRGGATCPASDNDVVILGAGAHAYRQVPGRLEQHSGAPVGRRRAPGGGRASRHRPGAASEVIMGNVVPGGRGSGAGASGGDRGGLPVRWAPRPSTRCADRG